MEEEEDRTKAAGDASALAGTESSEVGSPPMKSRVCEHASMRSEKTTSYVSKDTLARLRKVVTIAMRCNVDS